MVRPRTFEAARRGRLSPAWTGARFDGIWGIRKLDARHMASESAEAATGKGAA